MESIEELKNKKKVDKPDVKVMVIQESESDIKTISEEFSETLNSEDKKIFEEIKDVLINVCDLREFEVFDDENINDLEILIQYFKHEILIFEDDGIKLKLREDLYLDSKKGISTNELVYLFEKNKAREGQFTKYIKYKPKDISCMKDMNMASIASSIKSVDIDGSKIIISPKKLREVKDKDYDILLIINTFFR